MTLADAILELRSLGKDGATDNLQLEEVLTGTQDGTNTHFRLQNQNIVGTSSTVHTVYVTLGTSYRSQAGFTVDLANGLVDFTTAPGSSTTPFNASYNFNWFTDAEHTKFLNNGFRNLGFTDVPSVDNGLIPAMLHYALGYYWQSRASQYAIRYASSGATVGHSVDVVTKNFRELAEDTFEMAESLKKAFYERQGRREAPASATVTYQIDPGSPRR